VLHQVRRIAAGNDCLEVEFPATGGHVGFVSGRNPLRPFYYAEWRVTEFLEHALTTAYDPAVRALRSVAT
jgi:predicted alpha/beta-fold hydrolase